MIIIWCSIPLLRITVKRTSFYQIEANFSNYFHLQNNSIHRNNIIFFVRPVELKF